MQTWYECRVRSLKVDQGGFEKKVTDTYLLDAVSYTDAEARVYEIMPTITKGEFQVVKISPSTITEIINNADGEWWWKAKISLVTIDEEGGREKKASNYILIMAGNINEALTRLETGLEYMLVPYTIDSIAITTIADVFPYNLAEGVAKMEENEPTPNPSQEVNNEEEDDNE